MAIAHARPGEIIDIRPLKEEIAATRTRTLFKTDAMEVIRLVLRAGKRIAEHKTPGEIMVQCLEGHVRFTAGGKTQEMTAGEMLYLSGAEPHAVDAVEDSSVLVTILFCEGA
ncbi:MAG: cupin domain-containing protein [Planctomycetaceae bacterium]|nr:MAG: cupin domain-containing protein [Planctomycetaceae bacterium]